MAKGGGSKKKRVQKDAWAQKNHETEITNPIHFDLNASEGGLLRGKVKGKKPEGGG